MLEKELEAKVVKYAKDHGILTYKFVSPNNRGVPDRIFLNRGRVMFIEFKSSTGQTSKLQDYEIQRITEAGHRTFVLSSFDESVTLLNRYLL